MIDGKSPLICSWSATPCNRPHTLGDVGGGEMAAAVYPTIDPNSLLLRHLPSRKRFPIWLRPTFHH